MDGGHEQAPVQHHPDVPIRALQAGKRREGNQQRLFADLDFLELFAERRQGAGEYLAVGLAVELGIRMGNDVAVPIQQERIARAAEVQGIDRIGDALQADVPTEHAEELPGIADPRHRRDQEFATGGVLVGFGQHRLAACLPHGEPGSRAAVVVRLGVPG
ncbi:hypothetical protein D3C76_1257030 [compost metagenome]